MPALAATVDICYQALVTDVRYTVLVRFPIIAQRSKGTHYFHRVVDLVVINIDLCCDTWPVHHQTYGHLPSLRASPSFDWYQVTLLGDRSTQVYVTSLRPLRNGAGQDSNQ